MKKLISILLLLCIFITVPLIAFASTENTLANNNINLKYTTEKTEYGFIQKGSFTFEGENFTYISVDKEDGSVEITITGDKGTEENILIIDGKIYVNGEELVYEVIRGEKEFSKDPNAIPMMSDQHFWDYTTVVVQNIQSITLWSLAVVVIEALYVLRYNPSFAHAVFMGAALTTAAGWLSQYGNTTHMYATVHLHRQFWPPDEPSTPMRDKVSTYHYRDSGRKIPASSLDTVEWVYYVDR